MINQAFSRLDLCNGSYLWEYGVSLLVWVWERHGDAVVELTQEWGLRRGWGCLLVPGTGLEAVPIGTWGCLHEISGKVTAACCLCAGARALSLVEKLQRFFRERVRMTKGNDNGDTSYGSFLIRDEILILMEEISQVYLRILLCVWAVEMIKAGLKKRFLCIGILTQNS